MNNLCVLLMLMWVSYGQVTSSAIPINIHAGLLLKIEGANLDSLKSKNIGLQMALQLSNGDQSTPKAHVECTPSDDSIATTTTPQPTSQSKIDTQNGCPMGFIRLGDQCYYFSVTHETWQNALRSCMNLDADLVHPMSSEEDTLITTYLKDNHKGIQRWWIGGTDIYDEGHWVWTHDKSPMRYTNWLSGQPNNFENNENCAQYWIERGYAWNDDKCSSQYPFICQRSQLNNFLRLLSRHDGESTEDMNPHGNRHWSSDTVF